MKEVFEYILSFLKSRLLPMILVFVILFAIIVQRLFELQIINGESYLSNLSNSVMKVTSVSATRGRIFDKNGILLAYNELAYSVKISDSGIYANNAEKNKLLNESINRTINIIESNGDVITNDLPILIDENGQYIYTVSDTALLRFLRDVYGKSSVNDLSEEQKISTPEQVINYLSSDKLYGVSEEYSPQNRMAIINLRRYMSANSYNRHMTFTIAYEVSDKTVAAILENSSELVGVVIEEEHIRRYVDSIYTAHILGYTGNISPSELIDLKAQDEQYEQNDTVGKAGIEQSMELELQGKKGSRTVYVDKVGRITEVIKETAPVTGHDIYLTIDIELQKKVYHAIEDTLVNILTSKIVNSDTSIVYGNDGSTVTDIFIPIKSVYFALIDNNIISTNKIAAKGSSVEEAVYNTFIAKKESVIEMLKQELTDTPTVYGKLKEEMQVYVYYIYTMLSESGVINKDNLNRNDDVFKNWEADALSLKDFLTYAITQNWINIADITSSQYSSLQESYQSLLDYIINILQADVNFDKKIYRYLIQSSAITGKQICLMLFEQGILEQNQDEYERISAGSINPYNFMIQKLQNKQITPAQLALEPCSGSCVITDPNTGDVLAMVSYPSYDNNKLSGTVDAAYYKQLLNDKSTPLVNKATQAQTAPGSTFKPCAAIVGLEEGYVRINESIYCSGIFDTVTPSPRCWIYPGAHGNETVTTAIRDSCNVFFYNVGYRLAMEANGKYNSLKGTNMLQKYAEELGLASKSGIEIYESVPQASNTNAIASAIGQGTHLYSCLNLARYISTLANSGVCRNLTVIDQITDFNSNVIRKNEAQITNTMDIKDTTWNAVHTGMREGLDNSAAFSDLPVTVAGKSGTAQENTKKADHTTFISYAPYDNPEVAVSVVIRNGYTSAYAGELTAKVYHIYYDMKK